jgi:hypothetical protein
MHRSRSVTTAAAVYVAVAVAGLAPLMGWAWVCQARKQGRRLVHATW